MEHKFSIGKFPPGKQDYLSRNSVYSWKFPVERTKKSCSIYIPTGFLVNGKRPSCCFHYRVLPVQRTSALRLAWITLRLACLRFALNYGNGVQSSFYTQSALYPRSKVSLFHWPFCQVNPVVALANHYYYYRATKPDHGLSSSNKFVTVLTNSIHAKP